MQYDTSTYFACVAASTAVSGNIKVYQPGARVCYSFSFDTGVRDFPSSSHLTLTTPSDLIVPDSFHCSTADGQPNVATGLDIPGTALMKNTTYQCYFHIEVLDIYQTQGKLSQFIIQLTPSGGLTDAHHVPSLHTQGVVNVLVHTGASMSYSSYSVGTQTVQRE